RGGVVAAGAYGQGLAVASDVDLVVGVHALLTDGMDVDAVDDRSPGTVWIGFRGVGNGRETGGIAGGRDPLSRVVRGARRGVEFAGVVGFDDLGGVEVGGGEFREAHGQDGADREVRGNEHGGLR